MNTQGLSKPKNTESAPVIAPPLMFYHPFLALGIALHFLWEPLRFFPEGWFGHAAGWPLVVLGFLIYLWAGRTMSRSREDLRYMKPTNALVTNGPYVLSRNPIYLSHILSYVGISLAVNTIWPVLFLPVGLILLHYGVIFREEKYLERLFGRQYRQYRTKVRRWL